MKKWIAKAIIQKTISILPFSFEINYFFQKYVSKAVVLNEVFFNELITDGNKLLNYLQEKEIDISRFHFLELGTGWHPILPIYFYLCGAKEICTVDLNAHLRKENLKPLLVLFLKLYRQQKLSTLVKENNIINLENTLKKIDQASLAEILNNMNIKVRVGDITKMNFQKQYNLVFSVNVLEHIKTPVLKDVLASLYKNSQKKSLHFHSFGCYDHFCHFDKTISKFNYLKYSKTKWKLIDNNIQPQNRWRVSQFEKLFKTLDYKILRKLHSNANIKELEKIEIHEDFKAIPKEICAIDYGVFILEKP